MSESGDSSHEGSSFGASVASSMQNEDRTLQQDRDDDGEDLLQENHGFLERIYSTLHTFNKGRSAESKRGAVLRVCIEFLFMFAVVFNKTFTSIWAIDEDLWIYKAYSWLLIRLLVEPKGYGTYIAVFYLISAIVLALLIGTYLVAWLCKKAEENGAQWVKRVTGMLQAGSFVVFSFAWVTILDYFVFMFDCHWLSWQTGPMHIHFPEQNCLAMPHLAHMAFAAIMTIVFVATMLGMAVSGCELSPLTPNYLASPLPATMLKAMSLKACIVILSTGLQEFNTVQPVLMFVCVLMIVFTMFRTTLFFNWWTMHAKAGLWSGIMYTCALMIAASRDGVTPESQKHLTWCVLYGIFPIVLGVMGLSALRLRVIRRPLAQLRAAHLNPASLARLWDVYRFSSVDEVEMLCRVMRQWDLDNKLDPDALAFGEFILKAGMARFPIEPFLHIMYAHFLLEANEDGQGARTQLQLATKASPSLLNRYFVYVAQETAKSMRHEGGSLDLVSYAEFQRNYRACVKAHKLALQAQRNVWQTVLSDRVDFKQLQRCMDKMAAAEAVAASVYRRVLERYPNNGKLLKIYGRFLEFVKTDPKSAAKAYVEATKLGITDSFMSLVSSDTVGSEKAREATGAINEKTDGVVIINAAGTVMIVSAGTMKMFGYDKGELEGKNVSVLMPQPFSSRHDTFISNYLTSGDARILDKQQHTVALHKDRTIFPISLVVTHLSGLGQESMFMGVLRPKASEESEVVKVWATPGGTILCTEQRYRDWFGKPGSALAGQAVSSLGPELQALDKFVLATSTLPRHQVLNGALALRTKLFHKYLPPIDAELTVDFAGTEEQRILVVNIRCLSDFENLMVISGTGKVYFVTDSLTAMLGVNLEGRMVQTVVPEPMGNLHLSWLASGALANKPPPYSCRAGAVVHMNAVNGVKVPMTVDIKVVDDGNGGMEFVSKIKRATLEQALDGRRLLLQLDQHGVVLAVNEGAPKSLFGFRPTDLIGKPLEAFVNAFEQWKAEKGETRTLLTLLGRLAEENAEASYRVGVKDPNQRKKGAGGDGWSLLDSVKQQDKVAPAIMKLSLINQDEDEENESGYPRLINGEVPVLTVQLWDAIQMITNIETNRRLEITKLDEYASMVFGVPQSKLMKLNLTKYVSMGQFENAEDLIRGPNSKKAALKGGALPLFGAPYMFDTKHGDGQPLKLEFQAAPKVGNTKADSIFIRVTPKPPTIGSLEAFKSIGQRPANLGMVTTDADHGHDMADSDGVDDMDNGVEAPTGSRALSRARTSEWLRDASRATREPAALGGLPEDDANGEGVTAYVRLSTRGEGKATPKGNESGPVSGKSSEMSEEDAAAIEAAASEAAPEKDEDELVCDWRRARRLKKLYKMFASPAANGPSRRWFWHTFWMVAVMWYVHVIGLAIISTEIDSRTTLMHNIATLAASTDKGSMMALRAMLLQRCNLPKFYNVTPACTPAYIKSHAAQLQGLSDSLSTNHKALYLGSGGKPSPFKDQRIYDRWTFQQVPEYNYLPTTLNGSVFSNDTGTLWKMGNKMVSAAQDVAFSFTALGAAINNTPSYQYIITNGPDSFHQGYTWSLDAYTDYAWSRLNVLKVVFIILLALEVGVVQFACTFWEYLILRVCNTQQLRTFGVLLALPSATIRAMASKLCQVDDEEVEEVDEDEVAMLSEEQPQQKQQQQQQKAKSADGYASRASTGGHKKHAAQHKQAGALQGMQKALLGWMEPIKFKINGKRILPDSYLVYKFMVPLVFYMTFVAIIYGVSIQKMALLQAPLASLTGMSHVIYHVSRTRLYLSLLAFGADSSMNDYYRTLLKQENSLLRQEYNTLMYGGPMLMQAKMDFNAVSPASAFLSQPITDLFFRTEQCLRTDSSACAGVTSPFYAITHHGLDAMVIRHIQEIDAYGSLSDNQTIPSGPSVNHLLAVSSVDMMQGLYTGLNLFVENAISNLQSIKVLHILLMVIITGLACIYWFGLFLGHNATLRAQGKVVAGLLSHLPAETDVEGFVKTVVLQIRRDDRGSMRMGSSSTKGPQQLQQHQHKAPLEALDYEQAANAATKGGHYE